MERDEERIDNTTDEGALHNTRRVSVQVPVDDSEDVDTVMTDEDAVGGGIQDMAGGGNNGQRNAEGARGGSFSSGGGISDDMNDDATGKIGRDDAAER